MTAQQDKEERKEKIKKIDKDNLNNFNNSNEKNSSNGYVSRLNQAIKESKDAEVQKLKGEIDNIKKERSTLIFKIKDARRGLRRKEVEDATFSKILESQKQSEEENRETRNKISKLKKMKNVLEFKIATEATSLAAEKALVRKMDEVNSELQEEYRKLKLKRKSELIKRDIEEYKKSIDALSKDIDNYDKKLDELYAKIKERLGIKKKIYEDNLKNAREKQPLKQKREQREQQYQPTSVNLEDIAVIKKKKKEAPAEGE